VTLNKASQAALVLTAPASITYGNTGTATATGGTGTGALSFSATVSVRPEVQLGAYTDYPFELEIPPVTDEQIEQVVQELREQQGSLRPIDERGAQNGDVAAVKFSGSIDGEPFEGGSADRLPLIIGEDRMIPGWEANLAGDASQRTEGLRDHLPR